MEPEGSLPHSQVPAICPYPEPAQSSPYPHVVVCILVEMCDKFMGTRRLYFRRSRETFLSSTWIQIFVRDSL
jgi:hypothetical protein